MLVRAAMDTLATTDDDNLKIGEVVSLDRTIAFVKRSPASITHEMLKKYTKVTIEEYEQWFHSKDFNLPMGKCSRLISKSRFSDEIQDALNKEN